jgi:hypothetical protein
VQERSSPSAVLDDLDRPDATMHLTAGKVVLGSWPRSSSSGNIGGVRRPVGEAGREGGEPMPVAHLNDTELFYVEVGEGVPYLLVP